MYRKSEKYSFWNTKRKKYSKKYNNSFNISYCSNCGYKGHVYKECPEPKISLGIIAFNYDNAIKDESMRYKFLLICRKNTLGFVEFIRGKYNLLNIGYMQKLIDQLTVSEKMMVMNNSFLELWNILWYSKDTTREINCVKSNKQKKEYYIAESKFNTFRDGYNIVDNKVIRTHFLNVKNNEVSNLNLDSSSNSGSNSSSNSGSNSGSNSSSDSDSDNDTNTHCDNLNKFYNAFHNRSKIFVSLESFIQKSKTKWETPEWGFPKGRRNLKESNLDCSRREFMEETGLESEDFNVFYNINTFINSKKLSLTIFMMK